MSVFSEVMVQAFYYFLLMLFTILLVGGLQKGFFMNYLKVRLSFGKYVLVKVRSPLRDYFKKGWVDEGFLCYEVKKSFNEKNTIRLSLPSNEKIFYKCLAVMWIDVDDEKHAICMTNYGVVSGYDAVKNDNLHLRALTRPTIASGHEKIMLFLVIAVGLVALGALYLSYANYAQIQDLTHAIPQWLNNMKGTVIGGTNI